MSAAHATPFPFDDFEPASSLREAAAPSTESPAAQHTNDGTPAALLARLEAAHDRAAQTHAAHEQSRENELRHEIAHALNSLRESLPQGVSTQSDMVVAGAREIIKRFCAGANAAHQSEFALDLIKRYADAASEPTKATLLLSPQTGDNIRTEIATQIRDSSLDHMIDIAADENLGPSDCRLEWRGGALQRSLDHALSEIDKLFATSHPVPSKEPNS